MYMTTSHLAMFMECRSVFPVWLVLIRGHTAPTLVAPNQIEGISGQFPIMTATVSPLFTCRNVHVSSSNRKHALLGCLTTIWWKMSGMDQFFFVKFFVNLRILMCSSDGYVYPPPVEGYAVDYSQDSED
ncbi:hypothetical protein HW555_007566 [Spodoptera exigua]|uniref:Uncharacterized protein n=1 Tax=Spodoptera exigua TaxID=7107 RepID=A0A835L8R7_SPOEX|nr:hypothetical protein HW555_007566 [Spodoptera exigua]